jgi:hypothetical protein
MTERDITRFFDLRGDVSPSNPCKRKSRCKQDDKESDDEELHTFPPSSEEIYPVKMVTPRTPFSAFTTSRSLLGQKVGIKKGDILSPILLNKTQFISNVNRK